MSPAEPRPGLRDVEPYQAPQLDVPFRLNTNECPYPLPDGFADDLAEAVRSQELNRYPDREATTLREGLAANAGHAFDGTWAANGSNEIIQQLLLAYGGPGRTAVVFSPTYELHSRLSWVTHTDVVAEPLEPPFVIGDAQIAAAEAEPDVVFVCSPNNPTGNTQPLAAIKKLAAANGGSALVVVDEAYIEFGGESALGLVPSNPNVVIVRTFSKAFALAGARIGYCLADPSVVDDIRRVRLAYHLSALTQAAGITAIAYSKEALGILNRIREQRHRVEERLVGESSSRPGVVARLPGNLRCDGVTTEALRHHLVGAVDRVGLHQSRIIRLEHGLKVIDACCGTKPPIIVLRHEHDGHTIMHRIHKWVCFSDDHCRG
jgi:histidinol-phosphate aminotransferase